MRLSKVKESNSRSQQGRERSGERRDWEQASGCRNYILVYTKVGRDTRRQIHTGSDLHCQHTINSMIAGSSFPLAVTLPSLANSCSLTPASFCNSDRLAPFSPSTPPSPSSPSSYVQFCFCLAEPMAASRRESQGPTLRESFCG